MKRLWMMLLCLSLLLCACAKEPAETTPTTQAPTTQTTTAPTTEPTTVPTEPPVLYRNPLNGSALDAPYTGRIMTAVLGNTPEALPQCGISNADILYELETEGGITRFLAVFSQLEEDTVVGPVRSARTFFNNITQSYEGVIFHCGGSKRGRNAYSDLTGSKIQGWEHVDQAYGSNDPYFYRDQERRSRGVAREHTLFTTGKLMQQAIGDKEYSTGNELNFGLNFAENVKLGGFVANKVVVTFRFGHTTTFTYDSATGLYAAEHYGKPQVDGNTGNQMTFKNVMVLYTDQSYQHDGEYTRSYYELIGEGEGYLAINGEIVKIKWSREALTSPFVYTLEDGAPVTFDVGQTYVGIASVKSTPASYE